MVGTDCTGSSDVDEEISTVLIRISGVRVAFSAPRGRTRNTRRVLRSCRVEHLVSRTVTLSRIKCNRNDRNELMSFIEFETFQFHSNFKCIFCDLWSVPIWFSSFDLSNALVLRTWTASCPVTTSPLCNLAIFEWPRP